MLVEIKCPSCGNGIKVTGIDLLVKCPTCGFILELFESDFKEGVSE